jgi:hypothetical protein
MCLLLINKRAGGKTGKKISSSMYVNGWPEKRDFECRVFRVCDLFHFSLYIYIYTHVHIFLLFIILYGPNLI